MQQIFVLLLLLACPLSMMFMMRGGHGHSMSGDSTHDGHTIVDGTAQDARVAQSEREVAALREPDSIPTGGDGRATDPVAVVEQSRRVH